MPASRLLRTLAAALVLAPLAAHASVTINSDPFLFTERRGATTFWVSSHQFVMGDTSITPSGPGTSVSAFNLDSSGPSFNLAFRPAPFFPDLYAVRTAYTGQAGQWTIAATDGTDTFAFNTHVLDDPRDVPLLSGLSLSGPALTPHISWNAVDSVLFPSFCNSCDLGSDLWNYQVEVRLAQANAPLVYASRQLSTAGATGFDIPVGFLSEGSDYLIGVRLNHLDVEGVGPTGFYAPVENRSTAFLAYTATAAVPEPETYALLLPGLMGLVLARRRKTRRG